MSDATTRAGLARRLIRRAVAVAACSIVLGAYAVPTDTAIAATPTDPGTLSGVYGNAGNRAKVQAFDDWRGRDVAVVTDFLDNTTWSTLKDPWIPSRWTAYEASSIAVPMLPTTGGTIQQGAAGDYNSHFRQIAQVLVAKGEADAILRIGWEMNGTWMPWSAVQDPASYVAYFRQIVTTMRSVDGQQFLFEWAPNPGRGTAGFDTVEAYPGDDYVDLIGVSLYDQSWGKAPEDHVGRWDEMVTQPYGLQWHVDFAKAHGKRNSLPEWGLSHRCDGHGGQDSPYFIESVAKWVKAHDYYYESYFDYTSSLCGGVNHSVTSGPFPNGRAAYLKAFGPAQVPVTVPAETVEICPVEPTPTTEPTPTPTTTTPTTEPAITTPATEPATTNPTTTTPTTATEPTTSTTPTTTTQPVSTTPASTTTEPTTTTTPVTKVGSLDGNLVKVSWHADRTNAIKLPWTGVYGKVHIFLDPIVQASRVRFYLDDVAMANEPFSEDTSAPFDLAGGTEARANPFDAGSLTPGRHTLTVAVDTLTGPKVAYLTFFR